MKRKICMLVAVLCALTLWGAMGDSDLGLISTSKAATRAFLSLAGLLISTKIGGII